MKYTCTYETLVQVNQITRFNIPGHNYVCSHNHESLNLSCSGEYKDEWWHRLVSWLAINFCREPSVFPNRTVEISCTLYISGSTSQPRCRTA